MQKIEAEEWQVMDEVKLFRVETIINVEAQDSRGAPDTESVKLKTIPNQ